ncbi:hypothetical protein CK203_102997 [Vitis vinifera]|uniref:Uncharacterized protein n=1 Tax=Vitis vinifera TaxID=29760 RepID=A0A438CJ07_VITVI|nr:hypothetical protein CK203_102997 [Vitis vinifera]
MHFIEDNQTSINVDKYDIKHGHSTQKHRYSWNFENKVTEGVPGCKFPTKEAKRGGGVCSKIAMLEVESGSMKGTMPSNPKRPSQEPMWRGVIVSCSIIAACLFPLAIAGYWAYGNRYQFHSWKLRSSNWRDGIASDTCLSMFHVDHHQETPSVWCHVVSQFGLGCSGIILSALLVAAAIWKIVDKGIDARFFNTHLPPLLKPP